MRPAVGDLFFVCYPEAMLAVKRQVNLFHGFQVTRQILLVSPFQDRLDQQAADALLLPAGFHALSATRALAGAAWVVARSFWTAGGQPLQALAAVMLACAMDAIIKHLGASYSALMIAFVRFAFGAVAAGVVYLIARPAPITRAALPGMITRGRGAVVNVASLLALSGPLHVRMSGRATYAGAKAFLLTFAGSAASSFSWSVRPYLSRIFLPRASMASCGPILNS